jgi:transcriptional regulator with XRE-family HTH domain
MAKPFRHLREKMSPEARAAVEQKTRAMLAEMPLQELRQARHLSQEQLATVLRVRQASISKLERRTDMYISTLRSFIEAMGGELEITAKFPEGVVRITQFRDLDPPSGRREPEARGATEAPSSLSPSGRIRFRLRMRGHRFIGQQPDLIRSQTQQLVSAPFTVAELDSKRGSAGKDFNHCANLTLPKVAFG